MWFQKCVTSFPSSPGMILMLICLLNLVVGGSSRAALSRPAAFQAPDRRSCCAMRWRQGQAPGAGTKLSTQSLSSKVWPESIRRCMRTRWWCQSGPANLRNSCESWAVMAIKSWKNRKYCKIIWSDQWAFVASSGHLIYYIACLIMFHHQPTLISSKVVRCGDAWRTRHWIQECYVRDPSPHNGPHNQDSGHTWNLGLQG